MSDAPALTVIVPCRAAADPAARAPGANDHAPALARLLAALAAQTLAPDRFELLIVDDGSAPPLAPDLPPNARLLRQAPAGPAAARNLALAEARAPLTLFLNADAVPPPDTLAAHLRAHAAAPAPRAVLGRFDWLPAHRTPFVDLADSAGVLFPYHLAPPHTPLPGRFFWTGNLSAPTAAVRAAGGFDPGFPRALFEDVELGHRLERRGLPLVYDPTIPCGHDHALSFDAWLARAAWFGHEWVRFARRHGGAAFPLLGGADEPDAAFARTTLAGLLHQRDRQLERVARMRALLREIDAAVAADPERRPALLDAARPEAHALIEGLNTVAQMSGLLAALAGLTPDALAARAQALRRFAVVHTIAHAGDVTAIRRLLGVVPPDVPLVVAHHGSGPTAAWPTDPRLVPLRLDPARPRWSGLLEATDAVAFVFLEGEVLPSTSEVRALVRFLDVSPLVGAIGLAPRRGERQTTAALTAAAPRQVVATTREVLAGDRAEGGASFLDRLAARGLHQAALIPAGE